MRWTGSCRVDAVMMIVCLSIMMSQLSLCVLNLILLQILIVYSHNFVLLKPEVLLLFLLRRRHYNILTTRYFFFSLNIHKSNYNIVTYFWFFCLLIFPILTSLSFLCLLVSIWLRYTTASVNILIIIIIILSYYSLGWIYKQKIGFQKTERWTCQLLSNKTK